MNNTYKLTAETTDKEINRFLHLLADMAAAMMAAAINPVTPVGNPTKMKRGKRVSASLKIVVPSAIMDGL